MVKMLLIKIVISELLRSLILKFDYVIVFIEEFNDLFNYFYDRLFSLLMIYEDRLDRFGEKVKEKVF